MESLKFSHIEEALVFVHRNSKGEIQEKSLQRFNSQKEKSDLWRAVQKVMPHIEIHQVNLRTATEPTYQQLRETDANHLWCPYCSKVQRFHKESDYVKCEICEVSTADFYTKKYNSVVRNEPSKKGKKKK